MNNARVQKQAEIEQLKSTLGASEIVIVSHNKGMTVAQVTELRRALRANGASYKVSKNTLVKRAAAGTRYESVNDLMTGPTALSTTR